MTLNDQLNEAKTALHLFMTGRSVVEVTDQNGEKLRYSAVNIAELRKYIIYLEGQLAGNLSGTAPMSVWGRG